MPSVVRSLASLNARCTGRGSDAGADIGVASDVAISGCATSSEPARFFTAGADLSPARILRCTAKMRNYVKSSVRKLANQLDLDVVDLDFGELERFSAWRC